MLFPILVQPFIERVVEPLTSYLFYNIVADTILGRASYLQLCIYVIGLVCSLGATLYFLVRNQEVECCSSRRRKIQKTDTKEDKGFFEEVKEKGVEYGR